MKKSTFVSLVVILFTINGDISCGGKGRRTQTGLGFGNGGVTYTFRNGVYVTGTGTINPLTVKVGVGIRFRRDTTSTGGINGTSTNHGEGKIFSKIIYFCPFISIVN